ncbi:MAG TPA: hypothetical protein VKR58_06035 [Aquella sp.]|nr:hypothetical protein [Aquella sp.]
MYSQVLDYLYEAQEVENLVAETCKEASAINLMQLDILYSQDRLCDKCVTLPNTSMLCGGIRLVLDVNATQQYKKPILLDRACSKLEQQQDTQFGDSRMKRTGIPKHSYLSTLENLKFDYDIDEHSMQVYRVGPNEDDDADYYPLLDVNKQSLKNIRDSMDAVVSLADKGFETYFFHVEKEYAKSIDWDIERLTVLDFIHFEGVNSRSGTDYSRQRLFEIIKMRIEYELPTSISMLADVQGRNEEETEFFKMLEEKINERTNP